MNKLFINFETTGLNTNQAQCLANLAISLNEGAKEGLPIRMEKLSANTTGDTAAESSDATSTNPTLTAAQKAAATKKANAEAAAKAKADADAIAANETAVAKDAIVNEPETVSDTAAAVNSEDWPEPETSAVTTGTVPTKTLMDLRTLLKLKVGAHKDKLVKELQVHGAAGVSDLDPLHYDSFYKFMEALT